MTLTVSISDLRNNISHYLDNVAKGHRVLIRDEKRSITVAEISGTSAFDKNSYEKVLRKVGGTFSAHTHPEWNTKQDVTQWITKQRLSDQRSF